MATKKKNKKKSTKSKKRAGRKSTPAKKRAQKGRTPKKLAKRKAAPNKAVVKRKGAGAKAVSRTTASTRIEETPKKRPGRSAVAFSRDRAEARSGEQSGDLQGLSNVESADSESVDELIEEGNAFEAEVVSGVEDAGERGVREVRTREVPEDDVPGEYLDNE
jgi:phage repressor protein C with HTH and peptisase S24 domain